MQNQRRLLSIILEKNSRNLILGCEIRGRISTVVGSVAAWSFLALAGECDNSMTKQCVSQVYCATGSRVAALE